MPLLRSRIKETAANPGSGNVTPGGAVTGYEAFSTVIPPDTDVTICIESSTPGDWEVCDARYDGTDLIRGAIENSSVGGTRVTFTGAVIVFITASSLSLANGRRGVALVLGSGNTGIT